MNTSLLSHYRNPPFKAPTRIVRPSSPNPPRSPKRKHSDDEVSYPPKLKIDTAAAGLVSGDSASGTSSPRTRVARQLKDLEIDPMAEGRRDLVTPIPRKRVKRDGSKLDLEAQRQDDGVVDESYSLNALEIAETPETSRPPLDAHDRSLRKTEDENPLITAQTSTVQETPIPHKKSSPSTPPSSSDPIILTPRSVSPLPKTQEDLPPDRAAFTWREDEITGHEIDENADDDGEGINGVGFRPTPAIAYARKQRRRQQVNEWKAREAREARQRRLERRRGDQVVGRGVVEDEEKRSVRFAGVD